MVTFTVIVNYAIVKPLASVKGRKLKLATSKVKSTLTRLASSHKPGVVPSNTNRLRSPRRERGKRVPRQSLPRVLDPLPEDLGGSLVAQIEDELSRLQCEGSDKESEDSHSTHETESTLIGSDESYKFMKFKEVTECVLGNTELDNDDSDVLVYAKEVKNSSELELFAIKIVPQVALPEEDYYSGPGGLVAAEGLLVAQEVL
ncbi:hypothetical protein GY45DRAFT_1322160 [Cubamyces sp. BRFM 1775]|nr:hypothetical protein GY45DRAFT_1322160 [Cubamyces sp. BRFM 1775]